MTRDWLRGIALVLLCVVLANAARAATFPARTGRVVDEAGLLSQQARDSLTHQLAEHERTTSNRVVVVTVRSLQGMQIEAFSLALANRWAVGQAGRNNGVVLLVAPNERQARIEVGIGLERRLTNAIAADIIEQRMLPAFRAGRREAAVQQGVDGILAALGDRYQMVERPRQGPQGAWTDGLPFGLTPHTLLIGVVFLIVAGYFLRDLLLPYSGTGGRNTWRSDDDDWGSSRHSSIGGFSSHSSSHHSSGGGSFHGGGASGRW